MNAKQPFIINPNMRLRTDTFSLIWVEVPYSILVSESESIPSEDQLQFHRCCQCFCNQVDAEFTIYYSDRCEFPEPRVQSWLRKAIKNAIIIRGNQVLPAELHNIEPRVGLYSKSVAIKKLRNAYGNCAYWDKHINFDTMLVLLPPDIREEVIVHELCHFVVHGHGKKFWKLHTEKLGRDAKLSKLTTDIFFSRYYDQLKWLMK